MAGTASKRALRQARELLATRDWLALLQLSADTDLLREQPTLLSLRLAAAVALEREEVIDEVTKLGIEAPQPPPQAFALVREMGRLGLPDRAARILLDRGDLSCEPHFLQAANRLLKTVSSAVLRGELLAAIVSAAGGGKSIKPQVSEYQFAKRGSDRSEGCVTINAATSVSVRHVKRLTSDRAEFIKKISSPSDPVVTEYKDVFVDRFGQIWKEDGAVIKSLSRKITQVNREDVPLINQGFYALAATRGIYHFLVDRLPLFAWFKQSASLYRDTIEILLNDQAPSFEQGLLDLAGFSKDQTTPVGEAVFARSLLVARCGMSGMVGWSHIEPVFAPVIERALHLAYEHQASLPERVYISRSLAVRRSMVNEAEVELEMVRRGFAIYHFERIPLWHQIAILNQARVVAAPHGAGLSHLIVAKPGTKVIEILPIADGTYFLRWNYARLSLVKGLEYVAWLEEQPIPATDRWATTISEFLPFLDATLANFELAAPKR